MRLLKIKFKKLLVHVVKEIIKLKRPILRNKFNNNLELRKSRMILKREVKSIKIYRLYKFIE